MPVKRRLAKAKDRRLQAPQRWSLLFGEDQYRPAFPNEAARCEAWLVHRDALLACQRAGTRPRAWWQYESTISWPGPDDETATLYAAGLLSNEEIAELMPWWRQQFDRTYEPEFFYCVGPGKILEGAAARRKHLAWAGIPLAIIERWTRERERRADTIRKLKAGG